MGGIGGPEIFVIFLVVLLVFGPKRIPEIARGLGKGLREIRKLTTEFQREIHLSDAEEERRRIGGDRPARAPGPPAEPRPAGVPRTEAAAGDAPEPDAAPPPAQAAAPPDEKPADGADR